MGWQSDFRLDMRRLALEIPSLPTIVAWEGRPFDPASAINLSWWKELLIPTDTQNATLGMEGTAQEDLIYQMSVYQPIQEPITALEDIINDIEQKYYPGMEVGGPTSKGRAVRVTKSASRSNEDWRYFDVSIYCFVRRRYKA